MIKLIVKIIIGAGFAIWLAIYTYQHVPDSFGANIIYEAPLIFSTGYLTATVFHWVFVHVRTQVSKVKHKEAADGLIIVERRSVFLSALAAAVPSVFTFGFAMTGIEFLQKTETLKDPRNLLIIFTLLGFVALIVDIAQTKKARALALLEKAELQNQAPQPNTEPPEQSEQ